MTARIERLFERAPAILDGRGHGLGEPILWHLALRRHPEGTLALASRVAAGRAADPFSRDGWSAGRSASALGSPASIWQ